MLFGRSPSLNQSLPPQGWLLGSSPCNEDGGRGDAQMGCQLLAGPAGWQVQQHQNLPLPWLETGLVGERHPAQGFGLEDCAVGCSRVTPQRFGLHDVRILSPLELMLGDCSAGTGRFHINRLGVAREISCNKHFWGKNSGKWQVSKSLFPFPSTSVCRTLLRQLQNGAHTPLLPITGNWVIWSRTDFPSLTTKYGPKFTHLRQRKQASRCTHCLWSLAIVACCSLIHAPFMDNWKPIPLEI